MAGEKDIDSYIDSISNLTDDTGGSFSSSSDGTSNALSDTSGPDTGGLESTLGDDVRSAIESEQRMDRDGAANKSPDGNAPQDKSKRDEKAGPQGADAKDKDGKPIKAGEGANAQSVRPVRDGMFMDAEGNVTDQSGKILARKGAEGRLYMQNRRLGSQMEQMTKQLTETRQNMEKFQVLTAYTQQQGLSTDDLAQAARMVARFKQGDVVGVAKDIVARAVASGYNVTDILGKDVGDSIEMRAITSAIDTRLAPILQANQQQQRHQQSEAQAQQAFHAFVNEHEYSDVHGNELVNIARAEGIPLRQAYISLRSFSDRNGLDFSIPLGPQIQARKEAFLAKQNGSNGRDTRGAPMPHGARGNGSVRRPQDATALSDPDASWNDIINSVRNEYAS